MGASGGRSYALLHGHPDIDMVVATDDARQGRRAEIYPGLAAAYPDLVYRPMPGTSSTGSTPPPVPAPRHLQSVAAELSGVGVVLDLAADFRLKDPSLYPEWSAEHTPPPTCWASSSAACPSCTDPALASTPHSPCRAATRLRPSWRSPPWEPAPSTPGIIVDAKRVSGAGRGAKPNTAFCTVDEDFTAYGCSRTATPPRSTRPKARRHRPVHAHLAPMNRHPGHLLCPAAGPIGPRRRVGLLADAYRDEPFVVVTEGSPSTKATLGSNCAMSPPRSISGPAT